MATGQFKPLYSADDGYYYSSTLNNSGNAVVLGKTNVSNYAFVRFDDVTIPQGSTINSAYLKVRAYSSLSGSTCNVSIYFVTEDNPSTISSVADYDGRSVTSGVDWSSIASWTADTEYTSPDVSSILQTIINREGFSSGNGVLMLIKDNSSDSYASRHFDSIDCTGDYEAYLDVDWTEVTVYNETITESFSSDDSVPVGWSAQCVLAESFSSDDFAGMPIEAVLAESFGSNDTISGYRIFYITVEETISADDTFTYQYTAYPVLTESFDADDTTSTQWNAQIDLAESFSSEDLLRVLHSDIYGRVRESINLKGTHMSLKIQNSSLDESFLLENYNVIAYKEIIPRKYRYSVNIKGTHFSLKIQNNELAEILELYDICLNAFKKDRR